MSNLQIQDSGTFAYIMATTIDRVLKGAPKHEDFHDVALCQLEVNGISLEQPQLFGVSGTVHSIALTFRTQYMYRPYRMNPSDVLASIRIEVSLEGLVSEWGSDFAIDNLTSQVSGELKPRVDKAISEILAAALTAELERDR